MYGRMQFADFVVSQALQLNTRCLQALAESQVEESPREKQLLRLRGDVERLASLWQMLHWSVGKSVYRQGRVRTDRAVELIGEGQQWVQRAARQIAGKTDDAKRLRSLKRVARGVLAASEHRATLDHSELDQLFQEESQCWRDDPSLRQVQDSDLIEHGIVRAYEKSRRLCAALAAHPESSKRLRRARRWIRHCVNHLELLQPGLSAASKAQVWYLERLQATIEKQSVVQRFLAVAGRVEQNKGGKDFARVRKLAAARVAKLQSRSNKLMVGAFELDAQAFSREVGAAVRKLALQEIVLLPLPNQSPPAPGAAGG